MGRVRDARGYYVANFAFGVDRCYGDHGRVVLLRGGHDDDDGRVSSYRRCESGIIEFKRPGLNEDEFLSIVFQSTPLFLIQR